jgi:hypothetical protein
VTGGARKPFCFLEITVLDYRGRIPVWIVRSRQRVEEMNREKERRN